MSVATPVSPAAPLSDRIAEAVEAWAGSQVQLVLLAAELCDAPDWILAGSPTPAHYLAAVADVEACTAREWIRVGKRVRGLPTISELFVSGELSYSKVRALVSIATPENEAELAEIALECPAGQLRVRLAAWMRRNTAPEDLDAYQQKRRSLKWRTEADGMVTFTLRLQPHVAAVLIAILTKIVMRSKPKPKPGEAWPTVAQQHADAFADVLDGGIGTTATEVVFHVRGDGATCDDGTPVSESVIADLLPDATLRAMIHDAETRPIDASGRHRHPTARQKRVVKARDQVCVECGRADLLTYDHQPPFHQTKHTVVDELELRCGPCHWRRAA